AIAASANGNAKTVCEKRTNEPHFFITERMEDGGWRIEGSLIRSFSIFNSPPSILSLPPNAARVCSGHQDDRARGRRRCPRHLESFSARRRSWGSRAG